MRAKRFNFLIQVRDNGAYKHVLDFYEVVLGMERIHGWDRADSKGAVLSVGGNAAVEILGPRKARRSMYPRLRERRCR